MGNINLYSKGGEFKGMVALVEKAINVTAGTLTCITYSNNNINYMEIVEKEAVRNLQIHEFITNLPARTIHISFNLAGWPGCCGTGIFSRFNLGFQMLNGSSKLGAETLRDLGKMFNKEFKEYLSKYFQRTKIYTMVSEQERDYQEKLYRAAGFRSAQSPFVSVGTKHKLKLMEYHCYSKSTEKAAHDHYLRAYKGVYN